QRLATGAAPDQQAAPLAVARGDVQSTEHNVIGIAQAGQLHGSQAFSQIEHCELRAAGSGEQVAAIIAEHHPVCPKDTPAPLLKLAVTPPNTPLALVALDGVSARFAGER